MYLRTCKYLSVKRKSHDKNGKLKIIITSARPLTKWRRFKREFICIVDLHNVIIISTHDNNST